MSIKQTTSLAIIAVFSLLLCGCTVLGNYPVETIKFQIVDEEGDPITGAEVNAAGLNTDGSYDKGITDDQGSVDLTFQAAGGITIEVKKEGYYSSLGQIWDGGLTKPATAKALDKDYYAMPTYANGLVLLKPPSLFKIPLKKVIRPVPMYHKMLRKLRFPVLDQAIGFDFKEADWVQPNGKGVNSHILFTASRKITDNHNYYATVKISFPNPLDGIQSKKEPSDKMHNIISELILPQAAPDSGWEKSVEIFKRRENGRYTYSFDKDRHYLFRSETLYKDDKLIEACYGKILGDFSISPEIGGDSVSMTFTYFYNPDPDPENRSLEYNGENLLKGYDSRGLLLPPWKQ